MFILIWGLEIAERILNKFGKNDSNFLLYVEINVYQILLVQSALQTQNPFTLIQIK